MIAIITDFVQRFQGMPKRTQHMVQVVTCKSECGAFIGGIR